MRKQTKLVAVLSAAALLAIGASMTSFAATGWQEEDGTWVYYDRDEYKVSNAWKKSGNFWYYLDGDGYMATSKLLTDTDENSNIYYVDDTGRMVTNRWVELENEDYYDDGTDESSATCWYYFQNNGKAYKAADKTSFKTINEKKYAFDANGKMLYGWVNTTASMETGESAWMSADYYCGGPEDGAMAKGWAKIHVIDNSDDQDYWFYFNTNGKKQLKEKTINGKKYTFDADTGRMLSEWQEIASPTATPTVTGYKYYNSGDTGHRQKGWFKVVPSGDINADAKDNEDTKWFYAESDGYVLANQLKSINGKKYAFNKLGEMVSGLQLITFESGSTTKIATIKGLGDADAIEAVKADTKGSVYYFGSGDDGSMKVGNQNVVVDGDSYAYSFEKSGTSKGQGLKGINSNYIYVQGKKVKADSDLKYEAFSKDGVKGTSGEVYLVNTSGAIMKNRTNVKDNDEYYWCTNENGKVTWHEAEKKK